MQAQVPDAKAIRAATSGQVAIFTRNVPDNLLPDYGFANREEIGRSTYGKPVPVYTLKDAQVIFTDTWRVPVLVGNEYRCLLTVVVENGIYRAVDFGAVELAGAIQKNQTAKTTGMLRVYEIKRDFLMEGPAQANPPLIPIEYNR